MNDSLQDLANPELLAATHVLVRRGRAVEADLLRHLGEIDSRRLYLGEACSSMFAYSVRVLHFSEAAAYKRIRAARHKTADEIKRLLADRQPKPDLADCVRRVSAGAPSGLGAAPVLAPNQVSQTPGPRLPQPVKPATTAPLGSERYRVSFTASGELHGQLQELRALMRHQIPDGDLGSILGRAVTLLLAQVRERKFAAVSRPKLASAANSSAKATPSRQIPAAIRRAVARRDAGCCSYVSTSGLRCGAKEFLEFHHLEPWARTPMHSVDGIALRCRAHNQYAACHDFGEEQMERFRRRPEARLDVP